MQGITRLLLIASALLSLASCTKDEVWKHMSSPSSPLEMARHYAGQAAGPPAPGTSAEAMAREKAYKDHMIEVLKVLSGS